MSIGVVSAPCTSAASTAAAYGITLCPLPISRISIPTLNRLCSCVYRRVVYTTAPFRLPPLSATITALWSTTAVNQLIASARRAGLQVLAYASEPRLGLTANKAGEQYAEGAVGDIVITPSTGDTYVVQFIILPTT